MTYSFSYLESICCSMSSSNCCFLTCIKISQETGQVVWYSHLLKNFPPSHSSVLISCSVPSTVLKGRMLESPLCPGSSSAGRQGLSPRAQCSAGTHQALCLWQAGPLSLSLCPYQDSTAGPGARPHSLNYRLHRTQCSLLKAYTGRR